MTSQAPAVSIVLPTYNGEKYIRQSIESCINQTFSDLEIIVVNDGSTDETSHILRTYADKRIRLYAESENKGIVNSLNTGFSLTAGKYLTWTSDDNYYDSNAILTMVNFLKENPGVDFVYCCYNVVDNNGKVQRKGRIKPVEELDFDNCIGGCFLYTRKVYETIGRYDAHAFLCEDYDYWLRVRQKFNMKMINEILYYYRLHDKNLTAQYEQQKIQEQVEKVRDKYIAQWKRLYLHGRKAYYEDDILRAKPLLLKSVRLNPAYYETWRLLALIYLNKRVVAKVRELKN